MATVEPGSSWSAGARGDTEADVCMSDRLVPSRGGACEAMGRLRCERNENWAPTNEYQDLLARNMLGLEPASARVLNYRGGPGQRHPAGAGGFEVCPCGDGSRAPWGAGPAASASRAVPQSAVKVLDAPGILDDFYSHPVDWSARNAVAVALSEMVFLFDAATGRTEQLLSLPRGNATALRWTGEGVHVGVGTSSGEVQIWDACAQRQVRSLRGHGGRVGALAWHGHVLSSGAADAQIHHHDVRRKEHLVGRLVAPHEDLICGLDYNSCGMLASGGNDNLVCIWESAVSQSPLHVLREHRAAVKALRWCPWQQNLLATGGGSADQQVCLWNSSRGRLIAAADAESQVTGIVWGAKERELLTAHGYSRNQLSLWKYPSLAKVADLEGHSGRLLGIAQSPDGSLVCSLSADETLRFWSVFSPTSGERDSAARGTSAQLRRTIR